MRNFFDLRENTEKFLGNIVNYFKHKKDEDIINLILNAKYTFRLYVEDNGFEGADAYGLVLEIPVNQYVLIEDKITDIESKIKRAANIFLKDLPYWITEVDIRPIDVIVEQNWRKNNDLTVTIEGIKNQLVLRATGGQSDNEEFKKLRNVLIKAVSYNKLPNFIKICRTLDEFWTFIKPKYSTYQERRNYITSSFNSLLTEFEAVNVMPLYEGVDVALKKLNSFVVHEIWNKALERSSEDSEGAITAARTLLETVIKHILEDLKIVYDDKLDLPDLYNLLASELNIAPSGHTEKIFKQILGGCVSVVIGLGSVRNKLSDAHGKGAKPVRPAKRHAELAINLAGAMATFLVSTWESKKSH